MFNRTLAWLKEKWQLVIKSNASPNEISLGLAIGVFSGVLPLLGLQTVIMIFILWLLRRSNKVAAFLSSWVMNQFTVIPILYMDYQMGLFILPQDTTLDFSSVQQSIMDMNIGQLFSVGKEIFYPMMVGGGICGVFFAVVTYGAAFFILKYRKKEI
ncbi:MAG: DUF2062 domain-containing protein [Candidatus Magnetomorum sp.]|nr:DUF2062 domain-containing protein [Candidatus Magnetomorum sp.]